jgi:uncharacterized membrane protein
VEWRPRLRTGMLVGLGAIVLVLVVDAGLIWRVVHGPLSGWTFVCALLALLSLPVIAFIVYRTYDLTQLRYEFDRNCLMIVSAATRHLVPLERVERLIDGRNNQLQVRGRGLTWPGCWIGRGEIEGIGLTFFYATAPIRQQLIVVTPSLAYGISPPQADNFQEVFRTSRELGPSVEVEQKSVQSPFVHWAIWRDRVAQGVLLGGTLLLLALFGILCFRYPDLPNLLPMHFDVSGRVDRIAPRSEVFVLPIIGAIVWGSNGILGAISYRRERMVSYLLWSGALITQFLLLIALWNIVV